ncbi:MAG: von Willebrand factor type A domain-containing protein [Acidobacteriota bacterium]|nr:von Willebrand factor type A domain-containing protein [Acidobacteriota bacterium]
MKRAIVLLIALVVACTSVPNKPASLQGTVVDREGNPIPGVTVMAGTQTVVTDGKGHYEFESIPPGKYVVSAQLAGFNTGRLQINVHEGKSVRRDIAIGPASVSEQITVTASSPASRIAGIVGGRTKSVAAALPMGVPVQIEPQDTAKYATIKENGFVDTRKEKTTTFSIDVDGASYANVRRFLNANLAPPSDAVRIEEMINYFTYNYPQPSDNRPFSVTTEVAGCPWNTNHRLLRIGIQGKTIDRWKLAPNNLVFLLDVSGSMMPPERLPLITSALRLLVDQLRAEDSVAIVVYAGAPGLVLPKTSGADKQTILSSLDRLTAGGSTAGGAGIELAYSIAEQNFSPNANNRVILATDGDFNVGTSDIESLTKLIEEKRKKGIYLTCVGVGTDNYNDALMESLADKGDGNYYYLDNIKEAKKVFVHQLQGTLVAIAKDVKVQLEFDPALVTSYRQIGYEDRALANKDFEDDTKDAGELGSGHSVTALYEIATTGHGQIAEVRLRYKDPQASASQLITSRAVDEGHSAYEASPDLQFAAAVAEFGMLLRHSPHKGTATFADVLALARAMRGADLEGYREEFLRMVETSRTLLGEGPQVARQ